MQNQNSNCNCSFSMNVQYVKYYVMTPLIIPLAPATIHYSNTIINKNSINSKSSKLTLEESKPSSKITKIPQYLNTSNVLHYIIWAVAQLVGIRRPPFTLASWLKKLANKYLAFYYEQFFSLIKDVCIVLVN